MGVFSTLRNFFSNNKKDQGVFANSKRSSAATAANSKSNEKNTNASIVSSKSNSVTKSSVTSPTTSTRQQTSSAGRSYNFKDGRRYHADESVAYVLPNDDDEADRVHEQHWILRHALGGNYAVPITKQLEEGITVLDSGCGPATWAFEMGETYPRSKIHGIDASCVFPEEIKPANVEFVIGNIAKELPYDDNFFDFIFQRLLVLGLTDDDWTNALANLYKVLKPGGYIELNEPDFDNLFEAGPCLNALQTTLSNMSIARGFPPKLTSELEERLTKAGFVDITVKITNIPLNHSGRIGELLWGDYRHVYLNLRPVMAKANVAWEDEATYEAHVNQCGEEAKNSKTCLVWHTVYARKPQQDNMQETQEQ